ncbi:hypothetical protein HDV01_003404 [Terramyces sp. JEL0728]|nr:hypothetical protein HDV01_003404 [Terramyces sp. JEL0728]
MSAIATIQQTSNAKYKPVGLVRAGHTSDGSLLLRMYIANYKNLLAKPKNWTLCLHEYGDIANLGEIGSVTDSWKCQIDGHHLVLEQIVDLELYQLIGKGLTLKNDASVVGHGLFAHAPNVNIKKAVIDMEIKICSFVPCTKKPPSKV